MKFEQDITEDNIYALMFIPFFDEMQKRIENAQTAGLDRYYARYTLAVYEYCKKKGAFPKKYIDHIEGYDIPYIRMLASDIKIYDVQ